MLSILSRTPDSPKGWRCLGELVGQLEPVGIGFASDPGPVPRLGDAEHPLMSLPRSASSRRVTRSLRLLASPAMTNRCTPARTMYELCSKIVPHRGDTPLADQGSATYVGDETDVP